MTTNTDTGGREMIEAADYRVQATLTTVMTFSPIDRETPLTEADAIENARGTMPDGFFEALEAEGWAVEFTAVNEGAS